MIRGRQEAAVDGEKGYLPSTTAQQRLLSGGPSHRTGRMHMQLFQPQPILGIFLVSGVIGLLTTIFWIWMIIDCIGNRSLTGTAKLVWLLVVILLPLVGSLLYFFLARGGSPRPLV